MVLNICQVKHTRSGDGYEVFVKDYTDVQKSPSKFTISEVAATKAKEGEKVIVDKVASTQCFWQVSLSAKVLQVNAVEEIKGKSKQDVYIRDSRVHLTL